MLKQAIFALLAATVFGGSTGCCCLGHNLHTFTQSLHCNGCGGGCGGQCGGGEYVEGGYVDAGCGCGDQGCGDQGCGQGCGGHGGGWGCFDWGWGCNNVCSIFGCSSHYLDPQGACYGSYCGTGCQKSGCGPMYWGDWYNVPRTKDPCDCCANFVGPSHNLHGSTPWYYGPPKHGHGAPVAATPMPGEHIVEEHVVEQKPQPTNKSLTAAKPATRPGQPTTRRR